MASTPLICSPNHVIHLPLKPNCQDIYEESITPSPPSFTLKMATAIFSDMLENLQHSTRLNTESIFLN
jgi:hypothetical protein